MVGDAPKPPASELPPAATSSYTAPNLEEDHDIGGNDDNRSETKEEPSLLHYPETRANMPGQPGQDIVAQSSQQDPPAASRPHWDWSVMLSHVSPALLRHRHHHGPDGRPRKKWFHYHGVAGGVWLLFHLGLVGALIWDLAYNLSRPITVEPGYVVVHIIVAAILAALCLAELYSMAWFWPRVVKSLHQEMQSQQKRAVQARASSGGGGHTPRSSSKTHAATATPNPDADVQSTMGEQRSPVLQWWSDFWSWHFRMLSPFGKYFIPWSLFGEAVSVGCQSVDHFLYRYDFQVVASGFYTVCTGLAFSMAAMLLLDWRLLEWAYVAGCLTVTAADLFRFYYAPWGNLWRGGQNCSKVANGTLTVCTDVTSPIPGTYEPWAGSMMIGPMLRTGEFLAVIFIRALPMFLSIRRASGLRKTRQMRFGLRHARARSAFIIKFVEHVNDYSAKAKIAEEAAAAEVMTRSASGEGGGGEGGRPGSEDTGAKERAFSIRGSPKVRAVPSTDTPPEYALDLPRGKHATSGGRTSLDSVDETKGSPAFHPASQGEEGGPDVTALDVRGAGPEEISIDMEGGSGSEDEEDNVRRLPRPMLTSPMSMLRRMDPNDHGATPGNNCASGSSWEAGAVPGAGPSAAPMPPLKFMGRTVTVEWLRNAQDALLRTRPLTIPFWLTVLLIAAGPAYIAIVLLVEACGESCGEFRTFN